MSWMGTGYDDIETAYERAGGGNKGPRRVWMRPNSTVRLMFLDDDPTTFWEHQFQYNNTWTNWEPCVVRNKLGSECPVCASGTEKHPEYASFVGLHTVINMTPWFTKKAQQEVCFSREIFAAKLGGEKKPGVLKKLKKLREKYGRLRGLVFDIERPGEQTESCGSEFDLVEKVEPSDIKIYAEKHLREYLERVNAKAPADKKLTMEKLLQRNPWEPIDFERVIKPRPIDELRAMFSGRKRSDDDEVGGGSSGGSDDEMPY